MAEKQEFIQTWEEEFGRTMKVLKSFPADKLDVTPGPGARSAKEIVESLSLLESFVDGSIRGQLSSSPTKLKSSLDEFVKTYEQIHQDRVRQLEKLTDDQFKKPITVTTGPRQTGEMPLGKYLWFLLHDHIHHRGQLTVYNRLAGGKLPSVYGPSADEPWR